MEDLLDPQEMEQRDRGGLRQCSMTELGDQTEGLGMGKQSER